VSLTSIGITGDRTARLWSTATIVLTADGIVRTIVLRLRAGTKFFRNQHIPMKLLRFRVTGFRSVSDSGWIDTSDITALIGENESGKTNLLTPLWKLNPANDEPINLLADSPRTRYNEIRGLPTKPIFIEADFELPDVLVRQLIQV